jgi:hypothetical protein
MTLVGMALVGGVTAREDNDLGLPGEEAVVTLNLDRIAISEDEKPRNRCVFVNFMSGPTACSIKVIHPSSFSSAWRSPADMHLGYSAVML